MQADVAPASLSSAAAHARPLAPAWAQLAIAAGVGAGCASAFASLGRSRPPATTLAILLAGMFLLGAVSELDRPVLCARAAGANLLAAIVGLLAAFLASFMTGGYCAMMFGARSAGLEAFAVLVVLGVGGTTFGYVASSVRAPLAAEPRARLAAAATFPAVLVAGGLLLAAAGALLRGRGPLDEAAGALVAIAWVATLRAGGAIRVPVLPPRRYLRDVAREAAARAVAGGPPHRLASAD